MAETYFDTRTGELLIGEAAITPRLQEAGPDVVPLVELLAAPDFPIADGTYEKIKPRQWTKEDFISYGRWVLSILHEHEPDQPLLERHIMRMHLLGLGPRKTLIKHPSRFGSFTQFRKEVGSSPTQRTRFEDWSIDDFTEYARQLATELGRKPTWTDYNNAAREGRGPDFQVIWRRADGIGVVHERLGYPDVRRWTKEDYIIHGLRVLEVNGLEKWQIETFRIIASRGYGPTDNPIRKYFGERWANYRESVMEKAPAYLAQTRSSELGHSRKVIRYRQAIKTGALLAEYEKLSDEHLLARVGAKILVSQLFGQLDDYAQESIVALSDSPEYLSILSGLARIKPEVVTLKAKELGVDGDIWAADTSYRQHFYVSQKELTELKNQRNIRDRKRRAERRAA